MSLTPLLRVLLIGIAVQAITHDTYAQDGELPDGTAVGFHLMQVQRDFGWGLSIASPYFLDDKVAVRVRGSMFFHEHIDQERVTWTPYGQLHVGLIGQGGQINDRIRLYGEGGMVLISPDAAFSSSGSEFGGYGLFGFEFHFEDMGMYFIELGGVGTGARADELPGEPIYSNGFSIGTGFRVQW